MEGPVPRTLVVVSLLALGAALPDGAAAQRRDDDRDWQSRVDTTFAFSRTGVVELTLVSGEIVVTGSSRDEARVVARSERGRLRTEFSGNSIVVEVESDRGRMGETRYELTVPAGVRLRLRSTSGDITARQVRGPVDARSVSGDLLVEDGTTDVRIESVSGDVRGSRLTGQVVAQSVSGSIELDAVAGDVRAESTSGDVTLDGVTSRDVAVSTVSGEVLFAGGIEGTGRYEFHSHSGDIRLEVPENIGARFDVETYSGSLESAFQITLQPGEANRRPRRFSFTLGNGAARVTAETFSGDITIARRSARAER